MQQNGSTSSSSAVERAASTWRGTWGQSGAPHRRRGAAMDRRLLSERQLSAEQERGLEREGRDAGEARGGIRDGDGLRRDRYGPRARAEAPHGRRADRHAPRALQSQRRRARHGDRPLRVAPKTLEVRSNDGGTRVLSGDRVFLDVGTHATIPPIPDLAAAAPLTHIEVLELDRVPPYLIVLGGGYVGLELAQTYRRFGSRVTIVEQGPRLAGREDPDVADAIARIFSDAGIEVLVAAETRRAKGRSGQGVSVTVRTAQGDRTIEGSDILVAAGRTPNTAAIGLDKAGIELDAHGYVAVNDRPETSAPEVGALGDCAGSPQFTHVSFYDFRVIRDNLAGAHRSTRDRLVPFCMFTDPPLARVGLSEAEAHRRGIGVRVAKLPMSAVLRTWTISESGGFMKALVDSHGDRILGFTILGPEAGEVVAAVQAAMLAGRPYA